MTEEVWPEYNQHGDVLRPNWGRLFEAFPEWQFALYDEQVEAVVAEGHTAPCNWDCTVEGLGDGIDAMLVAALDVHTSGRSPSAVCAMAAEIRPQHQGRGLAAKLLEVMAELAREAPLAIERDRGVGSYWEPNVWIVHAIEG